MQCYIQNTEKKIKKNDKNSRNFYHYFSLDCLLVVLV